MVQHLNLREAAYSQYLLCGNTPESDTEPVTEPNTEPDKESDTEPEMELEMEPDTEPDTVGVFNAIKAARLRFSRLMYFVNDEGEQPEPQTEPLYNVAVSVKV